MRTEKQRKVLTDSSLHNWAKSTIVNLIILVTVMLSLHMVYETNDDFAIASRIADGYAEVNFINYYLCLVLTALQRAAGVLNAYVLLQVWCSLVSFICIYKLILDASDSRVIHMVSAAVIAVFSVDHYCTIQYTKTSALMLVAATMLMMDTVANRRGTGYIIASVLLLYAGAGFRIDGLIAAVAFAGLYFLKWLVSIRHELKTYFSPKQLLLYAILLALIGGCYGMDKASDAANRRTPELQAYKEYSVLRSAVVDYPVYSGYEENREAYEKIGISENDLNLVTHWFFDYDGAASPEMLSAIREIDSSDRSPAYTVGQAVKNFIRSTEASVRSRDYTGIHIIILCALAVWMLLSLRPRHWIYILAVGGLAAALYLTLYYRQRTVYRALYTADIGAAMWLLYGMACSRSADLRHSRENCPGEAAGRRGISETACRTRTVLVAGLGAAVILTCAALAPELGNSSRTAYKVAKTKVMAEDMEEYLAEKEDCFFVFASQGKKSDHSYITPWLVPDTYAVRNSIGIGSWGTMSPYVLGKLSAYGIENPVRDLIDNDHAFYVGNKKIDRITEYYNKWYCSGEDGRQIKLLKVAHKGGRDFWKVVSEKRKKK